MSRTANKMVLTGSTPPPIQSAGNLPQRTVARGIPLHLPTTSPSPSLPSGHSAPATAEQVPWELRGERRALSLLQSYISFRAQRHRH